MAGLLKLTIPESAEELKQLLHRQTTAASKERLQALYWLKTGKVKTRQDLARLLARGESTVYRWLRRYKQGGLKAMLKVKAAPGRAPKIPPDALNRLKQRLAQPEGFNSYGEVKQWLAQACQVDAAYKTGHQTVRYKLKAKLKVPRPQAIQADEQAQAAFKKTSVPLSKC